MGQHRARRARRHPQQDRRPHGGEPQGAGRGRDHRQRQADPRDELRRHPAGHRSFPLFRRLHSRPGRLAQRYRSRHHRLSLSRAARRGRPDHPVELPDPDGDVEARAGARRRQLRGPEAGRADADEHHGADGSHRRSSAAGRAQRGQRLRRRGGQAARSEQAHRQGRLHRRDHDRPPDHAICVGEFDPGDARARRQVAEHLLRRRDGRGRRFLRQGARRLRHVRAEPGRSVHLPEPRAGAGVDLRQVHGEGRSRG